MYSSSNKNARHCRVLSGLYRKALIYSKESVVRESEYSRKENWTVWCIWFCYTICFRYIVSGALIRYIWFVCCKEMNLFLVWQWETVYAITVSISKLSLILSNEMNKVNVYGVLLKRIVFESLNDLVWYYKGVRNDWIVLIIIK